MKSITIAFLALLLGACAGSGAKSVAIGRYDLGSAPHHGAAQAVALRSVDVHAPSWLGSPAMQYRLAYADAGRRETYADSRWAAPPAELLEVALRRHVASSETDVTGAGCRLRIELDEFAQVFDSARENRAVVDARILLQAPRSEQVLARRNLRLARAASPDAKGGVAAFSALTDELGNDIATWLLKLVQETPALAERCRMGGK